MILVRFDDAPRGILSRLEVETAPCRGLEQTIRAVLFGLRVQVVARRRVLARGRSLLWLDVVEFDGGRLGRPRRLEIQGRLHDALATLSRAAA